MKIIITERQKNVLFENKRNEVLIDTIKYEGWESAADMVGGSENLKTLVEIKTPIDFLNIFTDLDVVQSEENPDWELYRYEKGNNMMIYDRKNDYVFIDYHKIWSFLEKVFGLNYAEIQELTQEWLGEVYDLKYTRPVPKLLSSSMMSII